MSRRQFLKVTGQAAAGAAMPGSAIKGLMGGTKEVAQQVIISVQPDLASDNLADIFNSVLKSTGIAKSMGSKVAAGADIGGDGFEIFTAGNLDNVKKLLSSEKIYVDKDELANFGKPISNADIQKAKDGFKQEYQDLISRGHTFGPANKKSPLWMYKDYEDFEKRNVGRFVENWKEDTGTITAHDEANDIWYTISMPETQYAESPKALLKHAVDESNNDPVKELWYNHMVYDDLSRYDFSKPALEIIKQKGLYRDTNVFALRRIVDEFNNFKISLPADINAEIAKMNTDRIRFDDLKPGESEQHFYQRKRVEGKLHARKQKEDFKSAPPPSDEPDSWHTQSVEFESRLRRLVR